MKSYDALVVGGGPAGITAALYLARAGVRTALVEKLAPGGQVLNTEVIENYPGHPAGIKGFELADLFAAHLAPYGVDRVNDEVREMRVGQAAHELLVGGERLSARAVILCMGARYRRLKIPGEEALTGKGVSYCALCDGNFFRDKVVAVIGGGNSALEESLYLARLVRKLYLVHRRDAFRAEKHIQDKCCAHPKIEVLRSKRPVEIQGADGVEALLVECAKTGQQTRLAVDGVFVFVGFDPNIEFVPAEILRDANGILTDTEMRTNVPGVFAAGDVRSKQCRQVITAAGDGATAASAAYAYLEQAHA
jgi:thioredoxin reductase (NADPH)